MQMQGCCLFSCCLICKSLTYALAMQSYRFLKHTVITAQPTQLHVYHISRTHSLMPLAFYINVLQSPLISKVRFYNGAHIFWISKYFIKRCFLQTPYTIKGSPLMEGSWTWKSLIHARKYVFIHMRLLLWAPPQGNTFRYTCFIWEMRVVFQWDLWSFPQAQYTVRSLWKPSFTA